MRHFNKDHKINFVDENNVLVGFDNYQGCCEDFGWLLTKELPSKIKDHTDLYLSQNNDYIFDISYFCQSPIVDSLDAGDSVAFKMYSKSDLSDILYLTFYNSHNGYYGHGFVVKIGDEIKEEGSL